jgi:ribonuclease HI
MLSGRHRKEVSEYLGIGTNNVAELTAILRALELVKDRSRLVRLHTDSAYAIGVVSKGWKAKANQELVADLRALSAQFPLLQFVKVAGHAGVPENERADELAREAVARGR